MTRAPIRFHGELRTLVLPRWRDAPCGWAPDGVSSLKHVIEGFGVPHTEVASIRVDGADAALDQVLREPAVVDVYPWPNAVDPPTLAVIGGPPPRFLADAHLGALGRELRLLGFDTLIGGDQPDRELAQLSRTQGRVLLTRDRELLKHRIVDTGCWIASVRPDEQLAQIDRRFGLRRTMRPFTRCLECNGALRPVDRARVEDRLPPDVAATHNEFTECAGCGRVYWRGSHWLKLRARVDAFRSSRGRATPP